MGKLTPLPTHISKFLVELNLAIRLLHREGLVLLLSRRFPRIAKRSLKLSSQLLRRNVAEGRNEHSALLLITIYLKFSSNCDYSIVSTWKKILR
jgi:hypothetical protein